MSGPRKIQELAGSSSRRLSIAKLARSPISESPITSPSIRNGIHSHSFTSNSPFLKEDPSRNYNECIESSSSKSSSKYNGSEVFHSGNEVADIPTLNGVETDFSTGMDDPKIIKQVHRHLKDEKVNALQMEGGDITRDLYKIADQEYRPKAPKRSRSLSSSELENRRRGSTASSLNVPGGFRRQFIMNNTLRTRNPNFLTKNFVEFLSIYGHFAGEDLEDQNDLIACHYKAHIPNFDDSIDEESLLLPNQESVKINAKGTATDKKAYFLLLKAFIGTGVLFLPKAFSNGGLMFSSLVLAFFGLLSFWCYLILIHAKLATKVSSFGDIGLKLYGKWLQQLILTSIIISQIGFVAAYIVFTSENLKAFVGSVTSINTSDFHIMYFILIQLIIFLPLSLIRDITKLSLLALLANIFILIGLVTILYYSFYELLFLNHGAFGKDIEFFFNKESFSLFIGVSIFAFEGIGLIIPIQESMIYPNNFPRVLFLVIATISTIFIGIGCLGYLTFGKYVKTVIILNLPQDSPFVIMVQLLYAFAILLSTPLQLFPAIRLIELKLFTKTGKYSLRVKWLKNFFRFGFVLLTAVVALVGGQNLDRFVSFVGCFACIPLVYMYPPILHLKSCCKYSDTFNQAENRKRFWLGCLDCILVVIGGVAMIYTTYQIVVG